MKKRPEAAGIIMMLVTVIRCLATSEVIISEESDLSTLLGELEDAESKHLQELQ